VKINLKHAVSVLVLVTNAALVSELHLIHNLGLYTYADDGIRRMMSAIPGSSRTTWVRWHHKG